MPFLKQFFVEATTAAAIVTLTVTIAAAAAATAAIFFPHCLKMLHLSFYIN